MRRHYKLIHELVKERHPCSSCEKTFTSKAAVTSHMKIVHKGIKNLDSKGRRDHKCSFCDKNFAEKGTLTKHINTVQKSPKIIHVPIETFV